MGSRLASYMPLANMQKVRKIVEKMDGQTRQIYYEKKTALEKGDEAVAQQIGEGKDIMSILSNASPSMCGAHRSNGCVVKANMKAGDEDKLPEDEVLGQMSYVFPLES